MRSVKQCLNKQLIAICKQSIALEELSLKVLTLLPKQLAAHCFVASFNKGRLILATTQAGWASQLRYVLPELRDKLRKEAGMYQLMSIEVSIVLANHAIAEKKQAISPQLSSKAKDNIISESNQCTYEPLQKALWHLAHGTKKSLK